MRELVRDDVVCERPRALTQTSAKHHQATAVPDRPRTIHPKPPTLARDIVFHRDAKSWIVEKVTLHFPRQCNKHGQQPLLQLLMPGKGFQINSEDVMHS